MNLTVEIPDEIAATLRTAGGDLSRRVLEGFAIEEYKSERLSKAQLRRLLGFETRFELDDFLRAHQIWANVTVDDVIIDDEQLADPRWLPAAVKTPACRGQQPGRSSAARSGSASRSARSASPVRACPIIGASTEDRAAFRAWACQPRAASRSPAAAR